MGKIVVVFKSKYGATEKYAKWIAEELNADILEASKAKVETLLEYDTIIYGGGLYAGGIIGVSCITKNFEKLVGKKIAVFTVGLADPVDVSIFTEIINKAFTPEMQSKMKYFHLRGAMDYAKLNFAFRTMMSMVKKSVEKKPVKTAEDEQMLSTFGGTVDFTNKETIAPLITYIKSIG